ncbi:MAG: PIG-L deacetylase family protein [Hyphomicrobiales bacterium]
MRRTATIAETKDFQLGATRGEAEASRLGATDRVLFLAPHPDDETLAAGGLLATAAARGAAIRVLYATRGENNPWAQRAVERRLRIGPRERERWGARRIEEARAALASLGLRADAARSLDLPDQGLHAMLERGDSALLGAIEREIEAFHPTLVVSPAPWDLHPDHSATSIFTRLAVRRAGDPAIRLLEYVVHARAGLAGPPEAVVPVDAAARERKREAIRCHRSQLTLRREFLRRVETPEERFTLLDGADGVALAAAPHPLTLAWRDDGQVAVTFTGRRAPGFGARALVLVFASCARASGQDGAAPWTTARVALDGRRGTLPLEFPVPSSPGPDGGAMTVFANVIRPSMRRLGFFDSFGWTVLEGARERTPGTVEGAPEAAGLGEDVLIAAEPVG